MRTAESGAQQQAELDWLEARLGVGQLAKYAQLWPEHVPLINERARSARKQQIYGTARPILLSLYIYYNKYTVIYVCLCVCVCS